MGISLKRLEGWSPKQITTYQHDEQGRLASSTTVTEAEWDTQERSWMLALHLYELGLCHRCHQPLEQTTDPNNDPDNPDAEFAYVAELPDECHCCKVLIRAESKWNKDHDGSDDVHAAIHSAVLIPNPRRRLRGRRRG